MSARYPQLALDQQLCFPLYAAARAVTRTYGELLTGLGLTYPQYLVMLALWEAEGAVSVGDLGSRLQLDSGTLSPLLKRLEAAGYVARRRDEEDERRVLVELTRSGRALEARAAEVPGALAKEMRISVSDAKSLRDQLNRLIEHLSVS